MNAGDGYVECILNRLLWNRALLNQFVHELARSIVHFEQRQPFD